MSRPFSCLYRHGFVRVAVAIPPVQLADPQGNVRSTLTLAREAADQHAVLTLFPELNLSGYSNDDLFHQQSLLNATRTALDDLRRASCALPTVLIVGAPLLIQSRLFNVAVVIYRGQFLGVVPKTYLPNYREFYEGRQFASSREAIQNTVLLDGETVPFGVDLLFQTTHPAEPHGPRLQFAVEICEDLWAPIPPSTWTTLGGALVVANLSASPVTIGKAAYRRQLVLDQSAKTHSAYLYAGAGTGESTTDLAWDSHGLIAENGQPLAETPRYQTPQLAIADIDLARLDQARLQWTTFGQSRRDYAPQLTALRTIDFVLDWPAEQVTLRRPIERFPYVPNRAADRLARCEEIYQIQVHSLIQRIKSSGINRLVIGISGGLDSTQALLVSVRAMNELGLPRSQILGYSLPGFATSERTRHQALTLMTALGISGREIDIRPACLQMLRDLQHPAADGVPQYDVTFENVQAGQRTAHLFRLANHHGALVVGTGDLSELALGWATYGVGDHMSHYALNASLPKTLIQYLILAMASRESAETATVLRQIVETEISPELVPGMTASNQPTQRTEDFIGPYALQDFHLFYIIRHGFTPQKIAFLAHSAWGDAATGEWPDDWPATRRQSYELAEIKHWLGIFLRRFFSQQFKRSCIPNGPKIGSGGSLSPRGDWRMPSDASVHAWLDDWQQIPN